jgi:NAD-dependent DNA ligase
MTRPEISGLGRSAQVSIANRIETKAMQTLMGMVTGIVADAQLHDREIALLSTWLTEHRETAEQWPGCAIAAQVRAVLDDGMVTDAEREHLLGVLTELANTDFSATGSASSEPMKLPIDESQPVVWASAGVVHTGTFIYGTRAQCERLSEALGAKPLDNVSKATDVLVIGTRVSPAWVNESYGRKIMKAAEMRQAGHHVRIVSERYWFSSALASGVAS